jgi:hypothetical protein
MNCRQIANLLLVFVFLTAVGWAREDRLLNTGITPAAEGKVITSTDRNGNTQVEVQVKHLAPPQSLRLPSNPISFGSKPAASPRNFWACCA